VFIPELTETQLTPLSDERDTPDDSEDANRKLLCTSISEILPAPEFCKRIHCDFNSVLKKIKVNITAVNLSFIQIDLYDFFITVLKIRFTGFIFNSIKEDFIITRQSLLL